MSFLVVGDETHRIEFENGEWIDIRRSVSGIETNRWRAKAMSYKTKVSGTGKQRTTENVQEYDHSKFLEAKLEGIIVDSSAGKLDVRRIPDATIERIEEEFANLNPADADEDQRLGESEPDSSPTTP